MKSSLENDVRPQGDEMFQTEAYLLSQLDDLSQRPLSQVAKPLGVPSKDVQVDGGAIRHR